ncbi:KH domain-containing protein [Arcobacter sp. FWKO B]|uniref:KH domain-containing protein n=1 Tax=Arcobacter sp. FWKO B TaxID=2593672 RepID=UPI0018A54906|nr:KH domain-containing protein [Arcobacter sp. FWKO B]QOG12557.1 KH domain-containing protein [Arcobacter sp. FWKO B]
MVTDFIQTYAKLIASYPELISVSVSEVDGDFCEIFIKAHQIDVGKLIGKNGNMINSLKTIINGCKAKDNMSYKIQVVAIDE